MPTLPSSITIPTASGSVELQVLCDGYRKGIPEQGGAYREILYRCPWQQSDDALDALRGGITSSAVSTFGSISRRTPHQYPNNPALFCLSADGEAVGVPMPDAKLFAVGDGAGGDGYCRIAARYQTPPFDVGGTDANMPPPGVTPIPWTAWHYRGYSRKILQNQGAWKEETSGNNLAHKFPLRLTCEEISLKFWYVPSFYRPGFLALMNHVNSDVFFGYAAEHVIFDGYDIEGPEPAFDGTLVNHVTLNFQAQLEMSFNEYPKDEDQGFDTVVGATSGDKPYQTADLSLAWS